MATVRLDIELEVEERGEGYFAALTKPFAITAYGKTATKAEQRALEAVELLLCAKFGRDFSSYIKLIPGAKLREP